MNPPGPGLFWLVGYSLLPQLQPLLLEYSGFQFLSGLGLGGGKCPGMVCISVESVVIPPLSFFIALFDSSLLFY